MESVWFAVVVLVLTVYAVLGGFDRGVGLLHPWAACTEPERRTVLASIGPVWDGNEVRLIAFGGLLFLAFRRSYAAGFSGFSLPLMMVLSCSSAAASPSSGVTGSTTRCGRRRSTCSSSPAAACSR
jgi:cytochrome d ubiquinol oxidase subunit II